VRRSILVTALAGMLLALAPGVPAQAGRSFTLSFSGDILIQAAVGAAGDSRLPGEGTYDFVPLLRPIEPWVSEADFSICHLESTLSPTPDGVLYDESDMPRFSGPREVAAALAAVGFDACSLSSNHAWDRGVAGIAETIEVLEAYGIGHSGTARTAEERRPALFEVNGVRVALISYSTGTNFRPLPPDTPWVMNVFEAATPILDDARWAREHGAEFTIASLHWGTPYQMPPDGPQLEVAAALTASPDIDLIVGHHAHMVQPITWVNGKLVVYGMGDLLSNIHGGPSHGPGSGDGITVDISVAEQPDGGFAVTDYAVTPIWVDPATLRVLPIDHTLAYASEPALEPSLIEARALTVARVRLLGENVRLTPTPWPALACAGRITTVVGTGGADILVGTPGDDVVVGRGGDDLIIGRAGDDVICGGGGDDSVWGGPGADAIFGQAGQDLLSGGDGMDHVYGEGGDDRLGGGEGDDSLSGAEGDDRLFGHGGDDLLTAGAGTDLLRGGTGADVLVASSDGDAFQADPADVCRVGPATRPCPLP